MPSIQETLQYGYEFLQSKENYHLDAELLLGHLLQVSRAYLHTHPATKISDKDWQRYQELCLRSRNGEPIAYILGHKEFWSFELEVNSNTLIPRPETELLVETTLKKLAKVGKLTVADLGVGSGAVAIALALERPQWQIYATDNSLAALDIARKNMLKHQVNNVSLIHSDWYENLPSIKFDAIVSNPPYIAENDEHLRSLRFEPLTALVSGKDGLDAIRIIIRQASLFLKNGGLLLLEHGYDQAILVRKLLNDAGYITIETHSDLSGIPRVTGGFFKEKNVKNCVGK